MSLKEYQQKRSFNKTPEPQVKKSKSLPKFCFVVQKHAASHLHYDFRLEMNGVLKSWAVPKGPSLNPNDKRLAIMVEDHPYEYKDFEGTIPKGNYGAGTVVIWDKGSYELIEKTTLKSGHLKFILHGKKLRGTFSLIKMKDLENQWLLIKNKVRISEALDEKSVTINNHRLQLTHLTKLFWPAEQLTKADLILYYQKMAPLILPYLKDRPQSLHRHPNGIEADHFFQKNFEKGPKWIPLKKIHSKHLHQDTYYLLCQNEATLIYLAQLGCIEINPWLSRIKSLDFPDYCVIDLDPEDIEFIAVIQTARAIHRLLEKIGADNFCKTSGATGLHIYIPLGARYTYAQSSQFAELIATVINTQIPDITSIQRSPAKRQGKVYIDYLQNHRGQTIVAPYSLRPRPQAPVSTPLQWREVTKRLNPTHFNIHTIEKRLKKYGDIWKPLLTDQGIDLPACLNKLQVILNRL